MTRLRNVVLGGLAALAIGGVASSALAEETGSFQNRLNGATIGLPLGALPPPGLYTGLETAYLGMLGLDHNTKGNQGTPVTLSAGHRSGRPVVVGARLEFPGRHLRDVGGASLLQ